MVHREEFRLDASKVDRLPWLDLAEFRVLDLVLLELAFDKAERELGRIDRYLLAQILQKIRQSARLIFVAMRDDDATQLIGVLEHVGVVWQDEVDARMVIIGEHETRIVEHHVVLAFEDRHVLADRIEPAKGDDAQRCFRIALCLILLRTTIIVLLVLIVRFVIALL